MDFYIPAYFYLKFHRISELIYRFYLFRSRFRLMFKSGKVKSTSECAYSVSKREFSPISELFERTSIRISCHWKTQGKSIDHLLLFLIKSIIIINSSGCIICLLNTETDSYRFIHTFFFNLLKLIYKYLFITELYGRGFRLKTQLAPVYDQ